MVYEPLYDDGIEFDVVRTHDSLPLIGIGEHFLAGVRGEVVVKGRKELGAFVVLRVRLVEQQQAETIRSASTRR